MTKLLNIEASPRKQRSKSIAVAKAFLSAYESANVGAEIETLDLWKADIPAFDGDTIDAKYAVLHGQDQSAEQVAAWKAVTDVCEHFKSADKYLLSLPMWNFGIPYKLKHYIDVLTQPGQTFSFSPKEGYSGLVTGKPITVIYARGGAYSQDETKSMDFQRPYVEFLLGFLGFTDIKSIVVEPTLGAPDDVSSVEAKAIEEAKAAGSQF